MGLGLFIAGRVASSGLLRRTPPKQAVLDKIQGAAPGLIDDPLARRFFESWQANGELSMSLHPSEETVDISFDDGGAVVLSAKTSSAGPGYHAWLVEFVERLGDSAGIRWDWRDGDEEPGDETGYRGDGDFTGLRRAMANWLQEMARHLVRETELDNLAISMPVDFTVLHDHYAISPMGAWDRDWFERVSDANAHKIMDLAQSFFPTWYAADDARYWCSTGLSMCWVDLPWHAPNDDDERERYQLVLDCFARARELDPAIALPEPEIAEIESYLADPDFSRAPRSDGAGFKRQMMRRRLTGGWTVDLPGYFYEAGEDDGAAVVFWLGARTVRGSSLSFESEGAGSSSAGAAFVRERAAEYEGEGRTATFETKAGHCWVSEEAAEDDAGAPYWNAKGLIGAENGICLLTVSYKDPSRDWDWAQEVMKSVAMPGDAG